MNSLQEQLLKAGLVKKEKKPAAKKKQPKVAKAKRAKVSDATMRAQQAMIKKAKRDRELNAQKQAEEAKRAKVAQIKELIDANKLDREAGEDKYNFTWAGKIKSMTVTTAQRNLLVKDKLFVVTCDGRQFEVVEKPVAEKIAARNSSLVVNLSSSKNEETKKDSEDEYADYQVPDDLIW